MDGIDRGEPASGRGQRSGSCRGKTTTAPPPQRCHQGHTKSFQGLLGEGAKIAAVLLKAVQKVDGHDGLAREERAEEGFERLLVDQAEHLPHPVGRQARGVGRQELIQHGFGVAHAAGSQSGNKVDRVRVGRATLRFEDHSHLSGDLGDGQAAKIKPLKARQDGRWESSRFR